jgi:hypothetical protein
MGMFDYIKFECKLPDYVDQYITQEWQTKSLDRHMDEYLVDANNQLFKSIFYYEDVPEKDRPFYNTPEWEKDGLFRLAGSHKAVFDKYEKMDYTGEVECHAWLKESKKMIRFGIIFVHGEVLEFKNYVSEG